jgi:hypothetical protein
MLCYVTILMQNGKNVRGQLQYAWYNHIAFNTRVFISVRTQGVPYMKKIVIVSALALLTAGQVFAQQQAATAATSANTAATGAATTTTATTTTATTGAATGSAAAAGAATGAATAGAVTAGVAAGLSTTALAAIGAAVAATVGVVANNDTSTSHSAVKH